MKKRPLCMVCLAFLIIRGILLVLTSGQALVKVPASSIFSEQKQKEEILIKGQVYKKTNTSKIQILYLKNNSIFQQNNSYYESQILIYDDTFTEIPIGKTICVKGEINSFDQARNPGNFDQRLYYAKQNIYGYVWCKSIISVEGEENVFFEQLHQVRQEWKQILVENMSEQNGAVLSAMLLGEKSEIDAEMKELYQKNGISHVLAISGLHISFIGLGGYKLLRKMGIPYTGAGICSLLLLSVYILMIGGSVSVIRAYVMLLLRIGADMTGRVYDMLTALLFSAALIVVYQPLYLADAAFYMSHGAIFGILLILPAIKKLLPDHAWLEGGYASVAINIALFPILLWFYYEFPTYSLIINMLVIPLMTWVLGFGMLGSVWYLCMRPVGIFLLKLCDFILLLFEYLGEIGYRLPFTRIVFGQPNWWEVLIYYVVLTAIILMLRRCTDVMAIKKIRKCMFLISLFVIAIFIKFPNGKMKVTMVDVGQGDCIFVKGPQGKTYLIDGGSSDVKEVGKYRIEPFLKSQGIGKLDYVFVSHSDSDHCNGIEEMIGRSLVGVKINTLVLPVNYKQDEKLMKLANLASAQEISVAVINGGQEITEGNLVIRCLQPERDGVELEGNAGSMVLGFSYGKFDMLFTGDVENEGEEELLCNLPDKSYDILKVAHHGSKNSTGEIFLKRVNPRIALISAGEDNSYGHPHEETLGRLQKFNCIIYQTIEYGAISVETDGDLIDILPSSI